MSYQTRRFLFVILLMVFGAGLEILLWYAEAHPVLIILLSPVLCAANWVEAKFVFLSLSPLINELVFVAPINLLYFGLVGYWFRRITEEPGIMKYMMLLAVIVFILFVHWQATLALQTTLPFLKELNLPEFSF